MRNNKIIVISFLILIFAVIGFYYNLKVPKDIWIPPTIQQMADATVTILVHPHTRGDPRFGSGVFVSQDTVLTAWHLFNTEEEINVTIIYNGVEYPAAKILLDTDSDLAILYLDNIPEHPSMEISMEGDPPLGADIIMIGSPAHKNIGQRVVKGNISNLYVEDLISEVCSNDPELLSRWSRIVATTCTTAYGNSGGPIIYKGKVIGIFVGFPLINIDRNIAYSFTVYVPVYELNIPYK